MFNLGVPPVSYVLFEHISFDSRVKARAYLQSRHLPSVTYNKVLFTEPTSSISHRLMVASVCIRGIDKHALGLDHTRDSSAHELDNPLGPIRYDVMATSLLFIDQPEGYSTVIQSNVPIR